MAQQVNGANGSEGKEYNSFLEKQPVVLMVYQ